MSCSKQRDREMKSCCRFRARSSTGKIAPLLPISHSEEEVENCCKGFIHRNGPLFSHDTLRPYAAPAWPQQQVRKDSTQITQSQ